MNEILRMALLSLTILMLPAAAYAVGPTYKLQVAGLACPFCAYGIEKAVGALDGVENIETHIKDGAVIVRMQEGSALDEGMAKQAVEAAGFTLDGFEQLETNSRQEQE